MNDLDLRTAHTGRLLVGLSVPAICSQLVTLLYNMVDRMYIGRMEDGTAAMAGIGLCVPIITILSALPGLLCRGGGPLASMAFGREDEPAAQRYLANSFWGLTLTSLVSTALLLLIRDPMLTAFGASSETLPYAAHYLTIYLMGTLFIELSVGLNYYITAQGFAGTALLTTAIGAFLNILLDPLLIFSFHMGISGAAAATVISQFFSCTATLAFFFGRRSRLHIRIRKHSLQWGIMKELLALGLAPFFMSASEGLLHICFNRQAGRYGGDLAVSSMTILFSLFQFVNLPVQGLAQGTQPIISFNYGAGESNRVRETMGIAVKAGLVYSLLATGSMLLFPRFFIRLFSSDPQLVALGSSMLRVYIAGCILIGPNTIYQQTYTSLGDGKVSFFFAFLRKIILLIPLLYLLPAVFGAGIMAVVAAEPVSDLITALSNTAYFRRFLREKLNNKI